jgi:cytochrome P450
MVAHVACLGEQRNHVLRQIDKYVIAEESTVESTSFNVPGLLKDPLLNSALSETLRINFRGLNVRGVAESTSLTVAGKSYAIQKGSVLFLPMTCVHKDPAIYENPYEYRPDRFLEMHSNIGDDSTRAKVYFSKHGVPIRHPLLPWGGGHFMVPSTTPCLIL